MELTEILSKGKVTKGSKVVMMPAVYGHEDIGKSIRELEAQGIFVDHDSKLLQRIKEMFPEFDVIRGDALEFHQEGIITTVHYRPMFNYPHKTWIPFPNNYIHGPGFEGMVQNIKRLSPNFVLLSADDGRAEAEEKMILKETCFHIVEEGLYKNIGVSRYVISVVADPKN